MIFCSLLQPLFSYILSILFSLKLPYKFVLGVGVFWLFMILHLLFSMQGISEVTDIYVETIIDTLQYKN